MKTLRLSLSVLMVATLAGTLAGCNTSNFGDGVRPVSSVSNNTVRPSNQIGQNQSDQTTPSNATALAPIDDPATPQNASLAATAPVAFLPVLGPPKHVISSLSNAVVKSAQRNAITIAPNTNSGAKYQVKGYFSALDDGSGTRFIYIWDVLDRNGKLKHRISGEERTTSRSSDPWSAVGNGLIDKVMTSSMGNLRNWMSKAG